MVNEAPAAPNPTILNEPPPAAPPAPESKLYPSPPAAPVVTPPAVPPVTPAPAPGTPPLAPVTPPVTPPAEPKPPTEPAKPPVPVTPAAVPTDYDLKLPEGSLLSPEDLAATLKESKDAGLTKEQAEAKLLTKNEAVKGFNDRQQQVVQQAREEWKSECAKDSEFGGESFPQNMELAKRAWDKLASPKLKDMAERTGFGNHPEVVRMMVRVGKMFSEDKIIRGATGSAPDKRAPEDILFGNPASSESMH